VKPRNYLERVLTIIAVLLCVIVLQLFGIGPAKGPQLLPPVYAQAQSGDLVVIPVGNQEVRRLVVWDRKTNTVYDHDTDGKLSNSWVIKTPGEMIQKTK
jgi:hypothetical protein